MPFAVQEDKPYKCKECGMSFTSERDLIEHREYAKYRREGSCWQQNAFSSVMLTICQIAIRLTFEIHKCHIW